MKKKLSIILALFPILILVNSCTKSSSSQPTPTKWSFSFDLNGENHKASDISYNLIESCRYDKSAKRITIIWGSMTQPEILLIKLPADTVGTYLVDNINSYISYGVIAGNLRGYSSVGDSIEITSVSNDNIIGTFKGNLDPYILTNGIFKAEK